MKGNIFWTKSKNCSQNLIENHIYQLLNLLWKLLVKTFRFNSYGIKSCNWKQSWEKKNPWLLMPVTQNFRMRTKFCKICCLLRRKMKNKQLLTTIVELETRLQGNLNKKLYWLQRKQWTMIQLIITQFYELGLSSSSFLGFLFLLVLGRFVYFVGLRVLG